MQNLEEAIRHRLLSYLADEVSLDEFTDWLVAKTWNVDSRATPEAAELAYSIEFVLAERSEGLLTPEETLSELADLSWHAQVNPSRQTDTPQRHDVRVWKGTRVERLIRRLPLPLASPALVGTQSSAASW